MTEEKSMGETLKILLPKIHHKFKQKENFKIIPHEGKQDLEKSIPIKIRGCKNNDIITYKFIIVRDKDSGDCHKIKKKLQELCLNAGRADALIRIAIHELESWYLGDLIAIDRTYGTKLSKKRNTRRYRNPDNLANPSQELAKILSNKSKISWAKNIPNQMNIDKNNSESFNSFVNGVRSLVETDN